MENELFEYTKEDDGIHIKKYIGEATEVVIPSEIDGEKVIAIDNYAFNGCSSLTSIVIQDGVTSIGKSAFYYCSSLASVIFGENSKLTSIGEGIFFHCSALTNITIPNSVTSIGVIAFAGCSSLTSITIPSSVTSIGEEAFAGCQSLQNITLPEGISSIGKSTFDTCSALTSITIPKSVTSIGGKAFYSCNSLASITIPERVTSIGECAFLDCGSLNRVDIQDITAWCNISFADLGANPLSFAHNLYLNGELVTSLEIPSSITSIGLGAFFCCSALTSVTIPSSVTSIGDSAFNGCSSLTSLTISSGVVSIDQYAFATCSSLKSITLPDSVISIGNNVTYGCTALVKVIAPQGINLAPLKACTVETYEVACTTRLPYLKSYYAKNKMSKNLVLALVDYLNAYYDQTDVDVLRDYYDILMDAGEKWIPKKKIQNIEKKINGVVESKNPDFVYDGNKIVGVNNGVKVIKIENNDPIASDAFAKCKATKIKVLDGVTSVNAEFLSSAVLSDSIKEFEISGEMLVAINRICDIKISRDIQEVIKIIKLSNNINGVTLAKILSNFDVTYLDTKALSLCIISDADIEELMAIPVPDELGEESFDKIELTTRQINMLAIADSKCLNLEDALKDIVFIKSQKRVPFGAFLLIAFKIINSKIDIDSAIFNLYNLIDADSIGKYTSSEWQGATFDCWQNANKVLKSIKYFQGRCGSIQHKGDRIQGYLTRNNNIDVILHMYQQGIYMDFDRDDVTELEIINKRFKFRPVNLDENGETIYDYGDKKIKVELLTNLKLKLTDLTANKVLRSMPKASKKEDPAIVESILQDYERTKEGVESVKEYYEKELKAMFQNSKMMDFNNFNRQFDNIITATIATGVLWGIYDDDKSLKQSFRVIAKDDYVDINGNKVVLDDNVSLSIVDAGEISVTEVIRWKQILWGDGKFQLVRQFEAPIHYVPLDKLKERYMGRELSKPGEFRTFNITLRTQQMNNKSYWDRSTIVEEVLVDSYIDINKLSSIERRRLNRSIIETDKAVKIDKAAEDIVKSGNIDLIKNAIDSAIITVDNIAYLTGLAIKGENAEVTSYLMDVKKDMLGEVVDLDWEI